MCEAQEMQRFGMYLHTPSGPSAPWVKYFLSLPWAKVPALPPEAKHHECPITWPLGQLGKVEHEDAGGGAMLRVTSRDEVATQGSAKPGKAWPPVGSLAPSKQAVQLRLI